MYAVIAGLRLDTSDTVGDGPGWSKVMRPPSGFEARHPLGSGRSIDRSRALLRRGRRVAPPLRRLIAAVVIPNS